MAAKTFLTRGPHLNDHLGLKARYHVLSHTAGRGFVENPILHSIVLDGGKLIVGSVPVHTVRVTADHFTWVQQSPGRYTSGHLYTHHGGLDVHGVVYLGTSPADATEHAFLGTVAKPVKYETWTTKKAYPAATDPKTVAAGEWEAGPTLEIGFEIAFGEGKPTAKVKLDGVELGTEDASWAISQTGDTVLKIHPDDMGCSLYPNLFKSASINFDPMAFDPAGWGGIAQRCSDPAPFGDGALKLWKAAPAAGVTLRAVPAVENILAHDVVSLADGAPLDLKELVTILPDDKVGSESQLMFLRNMKWAMAQSDTEKDWLVNLLGEQPPVIDEEREKTLVTSGLSFYQDRFAKAYLASAFQRYTGPNAPEHRLSEAQEKKLKAFLSEGLAKDKDYSVQHQGIFVDSFIKTHARLRDYINDKNRDWADELYKKLTENPQFTLMVNRVSGCTGDSTAMTPVNNFACLLTALDPTGTKAKDYFNAVLTGVIQKQIPKVLHGNKDDLMQWLPDALLALLRSLAEGGQEREGISKAQALEMYQFYLKNSGRLSVSIANIILAISQRGKSGNLIQMAMEFEQEAESIWGKVAGGFAKIGKLFLAIGWIGGGVSIIMAFAGGIKAKWEAMTDPQKAEFVTGMTQSVIVAFDAVPVLWNGLKFVWEKGSQFARDTWAALLEELESRGIIEQYNSVGEYYIQTLTDEEDALIAMGSRETEPLISELLAAEGEAAEEAVVAETLYGRLFGKGLGVGVLKIFGAVASVAMAGWSLWTLILDVKKNGSVTTLVFDSLIFTANFLAATCLVINLFVGGTALPIAGAVLAILGVILAFLAGYLEKPVNPIEQWMVKVGLPFVDTLPAPAVTARFNRELLWGPPQLARHATSND